MSLRTRLMVGLAVLVLVAVASSGWLVLRVARGRIAAAQEDGALAVSGPLVAVVQRSFDGALPLGEARNRASIEAAGRGLVERGALTSLVVVDPQGTPVFGDAAAARDGALRGAVTGGAPFVVRRAPGLWVYAPLRGPGGIAGAARLQLGGDDQLAAALDGAGLLLVAIALVDGGLVLLFGALFIRRVVGPLEALAQAARRVADGQLDVPPVNAGTRGDEIARLTDAFNRMTASLQQQRDHLVAQEKLATVGRLAAGVAHEIGNPLAAVLGYVELLGADEPNADRRDMLARIHKETERIRTIVADLLEYARPPATAVEPVDLRGAVAAAASLLRPQARLRDVTVDNRVDAALPPAAGATGRVHQVLVNLLLNAADAMNGRGDITIEGRRDGDHVELRVADSGPGVPAADRARIFDPFFSTKEPGQGTGLGLSISRSIAQAFGGNLTLADSTSGATFVLRLRVYG